MGTETLLFLLIVLANFVNCSYRAQENEKLNGECSRFAYEYSVIEKLIALDATNANLLKRIEQLEVQQKKPLVVSAHVRLSKTTILKNTDRVKYDVEISNIGGAYDLKNGHFTALVSGIYLIQVQLCLGDSEQWMDLNIIKDGAVIGRVFSGDKTFHSCGSEILNVHLKQGDKVWVVREAGPSTSLNQDHGWNSFKAVLLTEN